MLPDNQLSSEPMPADFLLPMRENRLVDHEWGGVALNDSSQGLKAVIWQCFHDREISKICLKRIDSNQVFQIIDAESIKSVGLAFDQNMRPQICYVEGGITKLYWYDTNIGALTTTIFESVKNPCISLDDARIRQTATSDVIFAYQKGQQLCYRQQRDRYQTEYILAEETEGELWQIGMNSGNRFQFSFKISS